MNKAKLIELLIRICMGAFFVVSGLLKLKDPAWFLEEAILTFQLVSREMGWLLALTLPWLEVILGLCLIIGGLAYRNATWQLLLLTLIFTAVIAASWARGLDITCGCFGKTENATNYPLKLATNGLIAAALVFLAMSRRGRKYPYTPMLMAEGTTDHRRP